MRYTWFDDATITRYSYTYTANTEGTSSTGEENTNNLIYLDVINSSVAPVVIDHYIKLTFTRPKFTTNTIFGNIEHYSNARDTNGVPNRTYRQISSTAYTSSSVTAGTFSSRIVFYNATNVQVAVANKAYCKIIRKPRAESGGEFQSIGSTGPLGPTGPAPNFSTTLEDRNLPNGSFNGFLTNAYFTNSQTWDFTNYDYVVLFEYRQTSSLGDTHIRYSWFDDVSAQRYCYLSMDNIDGTQSSQETNEPILLFLNGITSATGPMDIQHYVKITFSRPKFSTNIITGQVEQFSTARDSNGFPNRAFKSVASIAYSSASVTTGILSSRLVFYNDASGGAVANQGYCKIMRKPRAESGGEFQSLGSTGPTGPIGATGPAPNFSTTLQDGLLPTGSLNTYTTNAYLTNTQSWDFDNYDYVVLFEFRQTASLGNVHLLYSWFDDLTAQRYNYWWMDQIEGTSSSGEDNRPLVVFLNGITSATGPLDIHHYIKITFTRPKFSTNIILGHIEHSSTARDNSGFPTRIYKSMASTAYSSASVTTGILSSRLAFYINVNNSVVANQGYCKIMRKPRAESGGEFQSLGSTGPTGPVGPIGSTGPTGLNSITSVSSSDSTITTTTTSGAVNVRIPANLQTAVSMFYNTNFSTNAWITFPTTMDMRNYEYDLDIEVKSTNYFVWTYFKFNNATTIDFGCQVTYMGGQRVDGNDTTARRYYDSRSIWQMTGGFYNYSVSSGKNNATTASSVRSNWRIIYRMRALSQNEFILIAVTDFYNWTDLWTGDQCYDGAFCNWMKFRMNSSTAGANDATRWAPSNFQIRIGDGSGTDTISSTSNLTITQIKKHPI